MEIILSQEVPVLSRVTSEYTPANGARVVINKFYADAAFDKNAVVQLVWDEGGAAEEYIWSIKGSSSMPYIKKIENCNGVRKLKLILDNGLSGALFMSGYVHLEVF